jgi:hypothetical protein
MEGGSVARMEVVVQRWANFFAKHPQAHVLPGRTRDIAQWRNRDVAKLVEVRDPTGKFASNLILIGFELEADAETLAHPLKATKVDPYAGYGSTYEFDPVLLMPRTKRPTKVR